MDLFLSGMNVKQARIALQNSQHSQQAGVDSHISTRTVRSTNRTTPKVDTSDIYNRYNSSMRAGG